MFVFGFRFKSRSLESDSDNANLTMKQSFFSGLPFLLRELNGGEGAGAAVAAEAGAGLSVTGDAEMDAAVMGRLGVEMETEPSSKSQVPNPKEGEQAERRAAEAESNRILELVKTTGKTKEEILADESAAKETADADRETLIEARMAEKGIEREAAEAEITAEAETATVQAPELTPEVKSWVDEQFAAKDGELATLKEQHDAAVAEVEELKGKLAEGGTQPLGIAPIDPLFLIDDPAVLETEAGKLRNFEAWALKNWDGVPATEASADGKVKAHPGFTGEEVRERYAQVKELRETILPAAREGIKTRQAHEAQARKVYPALFDPKRPEYKTTQDLLRLAPGLKAILPNIHIVIGDSLRGERIRLAEEKARASKVKPGTGKTTPPKPPAKPSAAAPRTVTPPAKKSEDVVDTNKFTKMMEGGATGRQALIEALG